MTIFGGAGAGVMPVGVGPCGVGTPITTNIGNLGNILPNVEKTPQGSRLIDPITKQYQFDSFGRVVGQSNVEHLVQMAISTVRGSSTLTAFGLENPGGVISNNFIEKRKSQFNLALADLVKNKLIEIISIDIDTSSRPVVETVNWKDLTTDILTGTIL